MITISTRLRDKACFPQLAACAELFSQLERALFVALYVHREPMTAAKSRFIEEHQITARQFNALRNQVEAKVESWRECLKVVAPGAGRRRRGGQRRSRCPPERRR